MIDSLRFFLLEEFKSFLGRNEEANEKGRSQKHFLSFWDRHWEDGTFYWEGFGE